MDCYSPAVAFRATACCQQPVHGKNRAENRTYSASDQITSIAGNAAVHDAKGNLTEYEINTKQYNVDYDLDNRIIKVDVNNTDAEYRYDALGRRTIRKEGSTKTALLWWGNSECAEYVHGAGQSTIQNDIMSHPTALNAVIARAVDGSKFDLEWYHKNYLDHVYAVSNDNGNLDEHYRYTAFGEVTIYNSAGSIQTTSQINNSILWNTRRLEPVSNYYLYKYRHYDPALGRWPSRDPIEERGGLNLYSFVANQPFYYLDYLGLREATSYEQALNEIGIKAISALEKDWEKMSMRIYLGKLSKEIAKLAKDEDSEECKRLKGNIMLYVYKGTEYSKSDILPDDKTRTDVIKENLPGSFYIGAGLAAGNIAVHEFPGEGNKALEDNIKFITDASKAYKVDQLLIQAVMYTESSRGWYDFAHAWFDKNNSILPMNINTDYWGDTWGKREDLKNPKNNVNAGAHMLRSIYDRLGPNFRDVNSLSSIYNEVNATTTTEYGARVTRIYEKFLMQK